MASKRKKSDPYAKHKIASIPVLLGILGFVLMPSGKESNDSAALVGPATNATPSGNATSRVTPPTPTAKPSASFEKARPPVALPKWERVDLSFLDGPNPFASYRIEAVEKQLLVGTTAAPKPQRAKDEVVRQRVAQEVTSQPVRYLFSTSDRKAIMLGNRMLEPGDNLFGDVRLQAIEKGSLVLSLGSPPSAAGTTDEPKQPRID